MIREFIDNIDHHFTPEERMLKFAEELTECAAIVLQSHNKGSDIVRRIGLTLEMADVMITMELLIKTLGLRVEVDQAINHKLNKFQTHIEFLKTIDNQY
jgi:Ni2+-binding GTPase involved in maturation of urease and hydrogenase